MTFVASIINLKGGVGKTTTTVALAETLACVYNQKVLIIDLDPQTNASIMLLGEERWIDLDRNDRTLACLFSDAITGRAPRFDYLATLQRNVSNVKGAEMVDLLPASLDMMDMQEVLAVRRSEPSQWSYLPAWQNPSPPPVPAFGMDNAAVLTRIAKDEQELVFDLPVGLLSRAVGPYLAAYDVVLIDCPPNLGTLPQNGLYLSHAYLIPTVPDHLSTYGIPQIVQRIHRFAERIGRHLPPLGLVLTKYQSASSVHRAKKAELEKWGDLPVFEGFLRQSNQTAAAGEFNPAKRTFLKKYGDSDGNGPSLMLIGNEFLNRARQFDASL